MSREIEKIAAGLFDKIRSKFDTVNIGDESAKTTADPEKARFFNFDYVGSDGENFGNVTVSLIDENGLKIYFSKNISEKLDDEQRQEWYDFLKELRFYAKRNLLTFDTRDIARSNLNIKDLKTVSKSDSTIDAKDLAVTESRLYGTPKTSFENVGSARIRIIHRESINPEVRGSRARHIQAIYVENANGERFMLEHNRLSGARAMARHISEGGIPYDEVGQHITIMVKEMAELGRFVRVMKHRTFEDSQAANMVEAAASYYSGMNRQLNYLKGPRAYKSFVENFQPQAEQLDEVDVNELKEKFVKKVFDDRMMAALPLVNKAYKLQEQAHQKQLNMVKDVVENRLPLQLITNEGMDEYIKALNFSQPADLVVRVLEDIAERARAVPEIAEFAKHWATNYNNISEDSDQTLKEHQALAVKLATHYLKDLRNLKENSDLRINENEVDYVDFDSGEDILEEGTWAIPDTPEKLQQFKELMANPLVAGTDGENATSALYDIIGDDTLFDRIGEIAELEGPKSDVRDVVKQYIKNEMPALYDKLELGNEEMDAPIDASQPASPVPTDATGQPVPPAPAQPQAVAAPAVAEDLATLVRLSGIKAFLVK
jgi:hypothetical protein